MTVGSPSNAPIRTRSIDSLNGIGADVVLFDPPFSFNSWSKKGEGVRAPQSHYRSSMTIDEIAALPITRIAGPNAWVVAWIPNPHVRLVPPLMDAWGIKFSGSALIWVKVNRDGSIWKSSGYSFRRNCEIAWLGRIGSPRRAARDVSELIIAPRGRHSSKPREQYFRIERLVGPGRVLVELFARGSGPPAHWHAAGDELELDAAPTTTVNEVSTLIYDPVADVWRGVAEANSGIRKRKAAGSDGWNPR